MVKPLLIRLTTLFSPMAIGQDGTIYIGCDIDLLAISPGGTLLWQYRVGEEINSTPAIATDGTIYVRSRLYYLCAVNPDGSQKWKFDFGSYAPESAGLSPVIADDGTIYTNGSASYSYGTDYPDFDVNALYAFNPDGSTKWIYNSISPAGTGINGFVPAMDRSGNIYLGGNVNGIRSTPVCFALNSSGTLLWTYQMPSTDYMKQSSPSIDVNGVIYFGATNHVYALNSNGTLKWRLETDIDGSSVAIGSTGILYFGSPDGYLNAIGDAGGGDQPILLTQTQVSQLYVSIFGRASEGEGNAYWMATSDAMASAASRMLGSPAAIEYFGSSLDTDQAFVEHIYNNTLGKTVVQDPDGIAYWVGRLTAGDTRGSFVVAMTYALANGDFTGNTEAIAAQNRFNNRVAISNYTANTIATCPDVNDLSAFVDLISGVTDNSATLEAAKAVVDAF